MNEFRLAAARLHDAACYQDVFAEADETAIKATFRSILRNVHPDRVSSEHRSEAAAAVDRLVKLQAEALVALASGTFSVAAPQVVFESRTMRHECFTLPSRFFDMAAGYSARSTQGATTVDSIVKVAKVPRDNELLAAEAEALTRLAKASDEHVSFYPTLVDSFAASNGRQRLRVNAIQQLDGFVNLEEVRARYPGGIHPLDMGWMWRRVLWALGGAHEQGVLHGALVPSHIMIHPALHGVVLVDWCYSVQKYDDVYPMIKAIVSAWRNWYPETVLNRQAPTELLDIRLAAYSMQYITDTSVQPDSMRQYFDRLMTDTEVVSAYELLAQFDQLLERLGAPYYPRSYRPFNW